MKSLELRLKDRRLLAAIVKGYGLKQLPADVQYSRDGADKRLRALCRKSGARCRAELIYRAGRQGLLDSELGA